jgi:phospholipid/cholesterol/gamma-HCH transport system ATP-binding protein
MGSILIKNILLKYDTASVINDLTERIEDGETYALTGPSGCGKTSLLKIIAGLALVNGGEVIVGGKDILRVNQKQMLDYHRICGFVFQNSALISNMSIYENLSLYYNYHTDLTEKEIYEKIKFFLDYVNFTDDLASRPAVLSTGERMLINIVRAISHDPEFIFWDNPLASLDPIYQKRTKNIILDLKKKRKTMVLVSNDFDFMFSVADKIGVLYQGKLIDSGTPEDIRQSEHEIVKELLGKE